MAYVKHSTSNPLGRKPWNAMLQPGGLGAFPPNAEAIGSPSVIVDRDAANRCGWKGASWAGAPVPRVYYPPDARLQYTTPRAQGLGAAPTLVMQRPSVANWGALPIENYPGNGGFIFANTTPNNPSTNNVSATAVAPATATPTVYSPQPAVVQVTTASGNTVTQSSGSSQTQVAGTPVPVGQPVASPYTDSSGNIWMFNGTNWYNASALVAGTPVPVGTSTTTTYTDSSGNVWTFNGTAWTSPTAAASTSNLTGWLGSNTIISAIPNWLTVGGAAFALWMLTRKK